VSKYTSGPWTQGYQDGSGMDCVTANGRALARVTWGCSCCEKPATKEGLENAKLIAAAPEMLEALKSLRKNYAPSWFMQQGIVIDELLAKAEGNPAPKDTTNYRWKD
jgi:hypothetical protein